MDRMDHSLKVSLGLGLRCPYQVWIRYGSVGEVWIDRFHRDPYLIHTFLEVRIKVRIIETLATIPFHPLF